LGLVKLIVLIAVVVAVIFAVKFIARAKAQQGAVKPRPDARTRETPGRSGWPRRFFKAEDLIECPRCGTHVRSLRDHECRGKA